MSQAASGHSQLRAMIVPAFATTIFGGVWLFIASSALRNLESVGVLLRILVGILNKRYPGCLVERWGRYFPLPAACY